MQVNYILHRFCMLQNCPLPAVVAVSGIWDEQPSPHLLSHFTISVGSINLMVGLGIESCSAILWLHYLVPSPPPFIASDEDQVCFRRWVWLGCWCLCTPCCGSIWRWVFIIETVDGGSVALYATAGVSSKGGVLTPLFTHLRTTHQFISPV